MPRHNFEALINSTEVRQDLRGRSVRAATYTWLAGIAEFVLRLGSTAVLARLVLPDHFGLVMMITAITAVADQFRDLGLSTVTVQRPTISHEEVSNLFWVNVGAGVLIAVITCAASPLVATFYQDPRVVLPMCALATNFVWGGLMVQHQALLTRQLRLSYTSAVRFSSSLISTALAIWLAWKGYGYWALVWREIVRCALLTGGMWAAMPWIPGLPARHVSVSSLLRFGADLSLANVVASVSGASDRLLLGRLWGASPTAMYRQAYQLLVMPIEQLLSPVYQVAQPGLSLLQSDPARFRQLYRKVTTVACFAAMPLSAFVAVHCAAVTELLLGPRWADAAPLLFILSLSTFAKQPLGSTAFVLLGLGRSRTYLLITSVQQGALILFICLGVFWGAVGVAWAEVAATYLLAPLRLHLTFKGSPVSVQQFATGIARPAIASIVMAAVLVLADAAASPGSALTALLIGAPVAVMTFCGTWLVLPGGQAEFVALFGDLHSGLHGRSRPAPTLSQAAPL